MQGQAPSTPITTENMVHRFCVAYLVEENVEMPHEERKERIKVIIYFSYKG